jgi:MFS family permease
MTPALLHATSPCTVHMQVATKKTSSAENTDAKDEYVNPDPYFLVPKALYFLLNWLIYSTHTYQAQFITAQWGISMSDFNLSYVFQLFNFVGSMVWGTVVDRTRKFKLVAAGCVIMTTLFTVAMAFPPQSWTLSWRLAYFYLLSAASFFFSAGTFPIIDAIVMSALSQDPTAGRDLIGRQKMFGTISHNISTFFIHELYDLCGQDYNVMFYSLVGTMAPLVLTLVYHVPDSLRIERHKHHGHGHGSGKDVSSDSVNEEADEKASPVLGLLRRPAFLFFLFVILAAGIVRSVNTNNHSAFLTDYLYLDKRDVGNLMLARLPFELGLLFYAKQIMVHTGPYWFLILGQLAGIVRITAYLILRPDHGKDAFDFSILLFQESLKGINSSMVSAGMVRIAADLAPQQWSGTAQTLVAGTWQGVSMACAALIAYAVLKLTDNQIWWVFAVSSFIGGIAFVSIFVYYSVIDPVLWRKSEK